MREQFGRSDLDYPSTRTKALEDKPGTLFCPQCKAISTQKRWFLDDDLYEKLKDDSSAQPTLCPACQQIEKRQYDGEVVLSGPRVTEHKQEVLNLVYNEETRGRESNPLVRLASVEDRGDSIYILTINQSFAQRLGKAVQAAYGGSLTIQNLPGESFSRVRLTDEDAEAA